MAPLIAVELLETLVFATLAAVSFVRWRRREDQPAGWLALTFSILGSILAVRWLVHGDATGPEIAAVRRAMAIVLAILPYSFFRFAWTLSPGHRWVERAARDATVVLAATTLLIPSISSPDGRWPWWYAAYAVMFSLHWTLLSLVTAARLSHAGLGQPDVARRRLCTLSTAAIVLNLALFIVVGSGGRASDGVRLATQAVGLVSGLLFLVGFVPPRALRTLWRRREVRASREAEAALMGAETADRVTAIVLPHAAELVGARAAVLVNEDGAVQATHGIDGSAAEAAAVAAAKLPVPASPDADPVFIDGLVAVPVRRGWLAVTTGPLTPFFGRDELGLLLTLAHLAGLALDRAELFDMERLGRLALAERESELAEAQRTAQIGSYTWDLATRAVAWSDEMARILGFVPGEVTDRGAAFASRLHPDDRARVLDAWRSAPDASTPTSVEYRIVLPDQQTRWIHGRVRPVFDQSGTTVRLIGTLQDITDRKLAEGAIAFQATHDALTALPNRVLFMDRLSLALARRRRHPSGIAVLFLDLDRFKWLNDSLGHAAGDQVLVSMADRLREALRPEDTLARFGGDEFVVLCEDVASEAEAESVAARLRSAVAPPVAVDGDETTLTLSVGIAHLPAAAGDETAEALVRDADAAMYRAKEQGRDRHEVFEIATRAHALARHETVNALRRGTARGELVVYYHPQVDIKSGSVLGVEALVRWNHPNRGLLEPHEFISLAEETGLIVPLGSQVLSVASEQMMAWKGRDGIPSDFTLSVNLSARQLLAGDVAGIVENELSASGLDPSHLCLEITESALLDDGEASARALRHLKHLGVNIAVDDFGTGFSALTYLKRFPVDVLKIDRSFVVGLANVREDRAIVASVIDLAHAFGLTTVAEGVETPEQLAELRALACERAQGYLWSRPMPADVAADWIATRPGTTALAALST